MDKIKKVCCAVMGLALSLVIVGAVYLAAVLLEIPVENRQEQWVVKEERLPVTPMQAVDSTNVQELARLFGAPLPAIPGAAARGEGRNVSHDGENVRKVTLYYEGVTITALRPCTAASLLLHGELPLTLRSDLTVMNLPASLAQKEGAFCVYFSDEDAAYAVYAPSAEEADFLMLLEQIRPVY